MTDQIYAKIKRLRKQPLRRILSNDRLFKMSIPSADVRIPYDIRTLLDDDQWFMLNNFSEKEYFPSYLNAGFSSTNIAEASARDVDSITVLISYQDGAFYFQRVVPSSILKRGLLRLGGTFKIEQPTNRLLINKLPDAIYIPEEDALLFKNTGSITGIFQGRSDIFREASKEEVEEFLSLGFISLINFSEADVSQPNRKRITSVQDTMQSLNEEGFKEMFQYISHYCTEHLVLDETGTAFKIENDTDLKMLIYGIDERFYTASISKQRRLANSVGPLG